MIRISQHYRLVPGNDDYKIFKNEKSKITTNLESLNNKKESKYNCNFRPPINTLTILF